MNIEQANAVPIVLLLENLNIKPARKSGHDYYYLSPIRDEKTASFHVNAVKNVFYDHGISVGGNCVAFAQMRLKFLGEDHTVYDSLRWIEKMSGYGTIPIQVERFQKPTIKEERQLVVKEVQEITEQSLIDYVQSRRISLEIARIYLKEVRTYNKKLQKHFFALGFKNESGGYELRNRYIKQCVNSKDISFIRGSQSKPSGVHIFEGFMDFLSVIVRNEGKPFRDDAIILNSLSCIHKAMELIKGYGYQVAYTWLDNDEAGNKALALLDKFLKSENGLLHKPMNRLYMPHSDVNAWHMKKFSQPNIQ